MESLFIHFPLCIAFRLCINLNFKKQMTLKSGFVVQGHKWEKINWRYFFEKVIQIFSCKLKSNALLY